ncbi:amino acid ABC transporter substrate-binding protein [filamentous cyanobacterium LEGE 11480]|uniref:Amino acid ABC transporter substrate-binding protein n=1 Tax=Romeriopsis navalis LEGE 11480 TaxID=2777977 RepID=A0A928VUX6_9CYAN|nr:amino acid ABC transporter substrate-binding protein [Romeriopsis navalis]MBE9032514.1 amino acid ABC transporter substrate-binding protein [Romeriopsis navalis LEGE 11480]
MRQILTVFSLGLVGLLATPAIVTAESVMDKVKRTGTLTAGTSSDAIPFAYRDQSGKLTGYSVAMLELMRERLEQVTGRSVKLDLVALPPNSRISSIRQGKVDVVCDLSSFTWQRDQQVDFSLAYATTGTQLLVKRWQNFSGPAALINKKIGAFPGTTNELAVKRTQPKAKVVAMRTLKGAFQDLRVGKIDAFAWDGVLLEAELNSTDQWREFKIVQGEPLSKEGVSCMVPENNSRFLDNVNYALFRHMQGFVQGEAKYTRIFDRWFGPKSVLPLSRDYRELVLETMRLTVDSREEIQE